MKLFCLRYGWVSAVWAIAIVCALCLRGGETSPSLFPFTRGGEPEADGMVSSLDRGGWVIASPEDLRVALREAQWGLLPLETAVLYDSGEALFIPDGEEEDTFLLGLLLDTEDWEKGLDVTVSEDPLTRETLFHGPQGGLVWSLLPEGGYTPWWAFSLLFPDEDVSEWAAPGAFDPSLVSLRVTLTPLVFPDLPDPPPGNAGVLARNTATLPKTWDTPPTAATARSNATDTATDTLLPVVPSEGTVVYVDAARGNDTWTGRSSRSRGGVEGPKRTVGGGMAAVSERGTLVISEGTYTESLNVRGTGVRVTFTGDVTLTPTP